MSFLVETTGLLNTTRAVISIESLSTLETEKLFVQVKQLLKEKSECDAENDQLREQHRLDLVHIESLNMQIRELAIENGILREERTSQATGSIQSFEYIIVCEFFVLKRICFLKHSI